jgi:hypothetical protein
VVLQGKLPQLALRGRSISNPVRVVAVVSGGNPDPDQLARLRA